MRGQSKSLNPDVNRRRQRYLTIYRAPEVQAKCVVVHMLRFRRVQLHRGFRVFPKQGLHQTHLLPAWAAAQRRAAFIPYGHAYMVPRRHAFQWLRSAACDAQKHIAFMRDKERPEVVARRTGVGWIKGAAVLFWEFHWWFVKGCWDGGRGHKESLLRGLKEYWSVWSRGIHLALCSPSGDPSEAWLSFVAHSGVTSAFCATVDWLRLRSPHVLRATLATAPSPVYRSPALRDRRLHAPFVYWVKEETPAP